MDCGNGGSDIGKKGGLMDSYMDGEMNVHVFTQVSIFALSGKIKPSTRNLLNSLGPYLMLRFLSCLTQTILLWLSPDHQSFII